MCGGRKGQQGLGYAQGNVPSLGSHASLETGPYQRGPSPVPSMIHGLALLLHFDVTCRTAAEHMTNVCSRFHLPISKTALRTPRPAAPFADGTATVSSLPPPRGVWSRSESEGTSAASENLPSLRAPDSWSVLRCAEG